MAYLNDKKILTVLKPSYLNVDDDVVSFMTNEYNKSQDPEIGEIVHINQLNTVESNLATTEGKATTNASNIAKIVNGTTTVEKATKDGSGNVITTTYATKNEVATDYATKKENAKSLYHLGAYDTYVKNDDRITTIYHKTGYVDLGTLDWERVNNNWVSTTDITRAFDTTQCICTKYPAAYYIDSVDYGIKITNSPTNGLVRITIHDKDTLTMSASAFKSKLQGVLLQYQLNQAAAEEILTNQPLNTLDSNGSQWVRSEWEKSLNLLNLPDVEATSLNGITYKVKSGAITLLTGTTTSSISKTMAILTLPAGTYIFKSFGEYGNKHTYYTELYYVTGPQIGSYTNRQFTLTRETQLRYIINVAAGVSVSNIHFNDVLYRGTSFSTVNSYLPYNANKHITNDEATFIKEEYLKSSNLLNLQDVPSTTDNGITYKVENGVLTLNGTATAAVNRSVSAYIFLPAGTYYFESFGAIGSGSEYYTYLEKVQSGTTTRLVSSWSDNRIITLTETTLVVYKFMVNSGRTVRDIQFKDMLVKGATSPTSFATYNGNIIHEKDIEYLEDVNVKVDNLIIGTTPAAKAVSDSAGNNIANTYATKTSVNTELGKKQNVISSTNKLDANLIQESTSKQFISATEKGKISSNEQAISSIKDSQNLDSFKDVEDSLDTKADKSTTYTKTEVDGLLGAKQNTISDLATIRQGASKGATAVQDSKYVHTDNNFTAAYKTKLDGIATGAEVNVQSDWNQTNTSADDFIKNKPTKVSAFTNDKGYLTQHQDIGQATLTSKLGLGTLNNTIGWGTTTSANGYTIRWGSDQPSGGGFAISEKDGRTHIQIDGEVWVNEGTSRLAHISEIPSLSGYATQSWVNNKGYITGINSSMITNALGYTPSRFSGSYNDLTNKPSIPTRHTQTVMTDASGYVMDKFLDKMNQITAQAYLALEDGENPTFFSYGEDSDGEEYWYQAYTMHSSDIRVAKNATIETVWYS